jgi:hypothetical protein
MAAKISQPERLLVDISMQMFYICSHDREVAVRSSASESWFRLATAGSRHGLACDEGGVFLGRIPLLCRIAENAGIPVWKPRAASELSDELSAAYGLPVDMTPKLRGLGLIAQALNSGELARAQIAALHMRLPDLPRLAKSSSQRDQMIALAVRLHRSGILDTGEAGSRCVEAVGKRNVSAEPRIPRGQAGGGQWTVSPSAPVIPAQEVIPLPSESPMIRPPIAPPAPELMRPLPPGAAPIDVPNIVPREIPANPYPDRPECAEEWAHATRYCLDLLKKGLLGKDGYRGMGNRLDQCIRGNVSESCGGNPTA